MPRFNRRWRNSHNRPSAFVAVCAYPHTAHGYQFALACITRNHTATMPIQSLREPGHVAGYWKRPALTRKQCPYYRLTPCLGFMALRAGGYFNLQPPFSHQPYQPPYPCGLASMFRPFPVVSPLRPFGGDAIAANSAAQSYVLPIGRQLYGRRDSNPPESPLPFGLAYARLCSGMVNGHPERAASFPAGQV